MFPQTTGRSDERIEREDPSKGIFDPVTHTRGYNRQPGDAVERLSRRHGSTHWISWRDIVVTDRLRRAQAGKSAQFRIHKFQLPRPPDDRS